jgi:hypothetical protein
MKTMATKARIQTWLDMIIGSVLNLQPAKADGTLMQLTMLAHIPKPDLEAQTFPITGQDRTQMCETSLAAINPRVATTPKKRTVAL